MQPFRIHLKTSHAAVLDQEISPDRRLQHSGAQMIRTFEQDLVQLLAPGLISEPQARWSGERNEIALARALADPTRKAQEAGA